MDPNRPGNAGQYFQGLEVRLRVGVVVGHVRPQVSARHAEIDQQLRDRFRGHRRPAIGMDGELVTVDALGNDRIRDERFGELRGLAWRDRPDDHVARVDVDDEVES